MSYLVVMFLENSSFYFNINQDEIMKKKFYRSDSYQIYSRFLYSD